MQYSPLELRIARESRGLTQQEAAEEIGCGLRTYKGWEIDGITPLRVWGPAIERFIRRHMKSISRAVRHV